MQSDSYLKFGPFRLKAGSGLWRNDHEVRLPPKELALLELLVQSQGEAVTHEAIYETLWPRQSGVSQHRNNLMCIKAILRL